MEKKGFISAIIALIMVILVVTMYNVQQTSITKNQNDFSQQQLFELKTQTQTVQQLLDKATSDAMSDCYNRLTCNLLDECKDLGGNPEYSKKITAYYESILDVARNDLQLDCVLTNMPQNLPGPNVSFSFDMECYKNFPVQFAAKAKKTIPVDKTITTNWVIAVPPALDYCELQVMDEQSGLCDVTVNKNCT